MESTISEAPFKNPIEKVQDWLQNVNWTQPTINAYSAPSSSPASIQPTTTGQYIGPVTQSGNFNSQPYSVNNTPTTPILNYTPAGNTTKTTTSNNPAPQQNNNESLIQAMMKGGHSRESAMATIQGRGYDALAKEYLGNTGGGYTSPEGNSYGSQEEYNKLIDDSYNPQISALNEQENNLNMGQTSALEQAQLAFNTQQGLAQGQLQTANNQLGEVATKGQSAYESALAQARQVYDQLQKGYQQRFGSATSAGQAATEIGNVERLKQQGQSYKQLQDVNRQVEMGKMDVQKQYDQNILQLEQNKQQAITAVQSDFRDKLAQINASKGMVESAKAQAKLQALQQLRAQVLQVQQQETSFKQQLEAQKQQAAIQLDTYAKQLAMSKSGATNNAQTGIDRMGQKITPQATVSNGFQNQTYNPTGQITTQYKDPRDLISKNIWGQ